MTAGQYHKPHCWNSWQWVSIIKLHCRNPWLQGGIINHAAETHDSRSESYTMLLKHIAAGQYRTPFIWNPWQRVNIINHTAEIHDSRSVSWTMLLTNMTAGIIHRAAEMHATSQHRWLVVCNMCRAQTHSSEQACTISITAGTGKIMPLCLKTDNGSLCGIPIGILRVFFFNWSYNINFTCPTESPAKCLF